MDCTLAHPKTGMTRRTIISRNERSRWKIIQEILKVVFDEKKAKRHKSCGGRVLTGEILRTLLFGG